MNFDNRLRICTIMFAFLQPVYGRRFVLDEKVLKKLGRTDLLKLLLIEAKRADELEKKVDRLTLELSEERLKSETIFKLAFPYDDRQIK